MTVMDRINTLGGDIPIEVGEANTEELRAIAIQIADLLVRSFPDLRQSFPLPRSNSGREASTRQRRSRWPTRPTRSTKPT